MTLLPDIKPWCGGSSAFDEIEAEIAKHEGTRSPCATGPLPLVVRLRMVVDRYQAEIQQERIEKRVISDGKDCLRKKVDTLNAAVRQQLEEVKAERDALRAALGWYADEDNYRYPTGAEMCEDHSYAAKPIDADDGQVARAALGVPDGE